MMHSSAENRAPSSARARACDRGRAAIVAIQTPGPRLPVLLWPLETTSMAVDRYALRFLGTLSLAAVACNGGGGESSSESETASGSVSVSVSVTATDTATGSESDTATTTASGSESMSASGSTTTS